MYGITHEFSLQKWVKVAKVAKLRKFLHDAKWSTSDVAAIGRARFLNFTCISAWKTLLHGLEKVISVLTWGACESGKCISGNVTAIREMSLNQSFYNNVKESWKRCTNFARYFGALSPPPPENLRKRNNCVDRMVYAWHSWYLNVWYQARICIAKVEIVQKKLAKTWTWHKMKARLLNLMAQP